MKKSFFFFISALLFALNINAQSFKPTLSGEQLLLISEEMPQNIIAAGEAARLNNFPVEIYLSEGVYIKALGVENGQPVYAIMRDMLKPFNDISSGFYAEIEREFNISEGRITFADGKILNPTLGYPQVKAQNALGRDPFLLVLNNTAKAVMAFDKTTGDIISMNYVPGDNNLGTAKQARLSPQGRITISDQLNNVVFKYDTSGTPLGVFAPAGGANVAQMSNIRGHNYKANGNLLVTSAAGTNINSVVEFDPSGNYVGTFIASGAGLLNSPWDILFRASDILVSASGTRNILRFDYSGNFIANLVDSIAYTQQMCVGDSGQIIATNFSGVTSGLYIYTSTGTLIRALMTVQANRGVYKLGNGNLLTTNATGIYEVNPYSGALIRTIISGISGQYISVYDWASVIPVELVSFSASKLSNDGIAINWRTASESNNAGFEIERSIDGYSFAKIGFVNGSGTSTTGNSYSFIDKNIVNDIVYYRLKQIDYSGTYKYSKSINVAGDILKDFTLEQNYPNPFNPSTIISFATPKSEIVNITIYNILGQKVAEPANGKFEAGKHEITFNANNLPTGTYYCKITAGSFIKTIKMSFMK